VSDQVPSGSYSNVPVERVAWGTPFEALVEEAVNKAGAKRVMVVASNTLRTKTDAVARLEKKLGDRVVSIFSRGKEHTPLSTVLDCATDARDAKPDIFVTVGGSTPIDMVKIVAVALAHDLTTRETLRGAIGKMFPDPVPLRQIAVPTTLSGGEFTSFGGGTDEDTQAKVMFAAPNLCAQTVILDPALTTHTPDWLWFSTAVRAIDHAVEGTLSPRTNPMIVAQALRALEMFFTHLPRSKRNPNNLEARLACQQATWLSTAGLGRVSMGASHGIGYILGTVAHVPHGYTSCVTLPNVLEWSAPATEAAQALIARAMGDAKRSPASQLRELLSTLELPQTLGDVGVRDDQIDKIAQIAVKHPVVLANARPIRSVEDTRAILELARARH
jgi:alcohol dehydrogenase class IV